MSYYVVVFRAKDGIRALRRTILRRGGARSNNHREQHNGWAGISALKGYYTQSVRQSMTFASFGEASEACEIIRAHDFWSEKLIAPMRPVVMPVEEATKRMRKAA